MKGDGERCGAEQRAEQEQGVHPAVLSFGQDLTEEVHFEDPRREELMAREVTNPTDTAQAMTMPSHQ